MLQSMVATESAESRAHPDNTRDVWELSVWDPLPISLQLMALFSPLHILIYMFELPLNSLDARPSVTVFKCLVLQVTLSALLLLLNAKNEQKQKDTAIIQKEVFREYDTKFVHPRLHPVVRDVATQVTMDHTEDDPEDSVLSGTPTTLIRRGFQTHPNPNYMKHIDPDNSRGASPASNIMNPSLFTPATKSRHSDQYGISQQTKTRKVRQSMPASPAISSTAVAGTSTGAHGGHLGVYNHSNSPLKKATSLGDIGNEGGFFSPRNSRELAAIEQRDVTERLNRRASPLKEDPVSTFGDPYQSPISVPNPFVRHRNNAQRYERFPSRW